MTTTTDRLPQNLRWAWIAAAVVAVCIAALFVRGALVGSAPLKVIASSMFAAIGSTLAGVHTTVTKRAAR